MGGYGDGCKCECQGLEKILQLLKVDRHYISPDGISKDPT